MLDNLLQNIYLGRMRVLNSSTGERLLAIDSIDKAAISISKQYPLYTILFIEKGQGVFHADFGSFPFNAPVLLFSTPLQTIDLDTTEVRGTITQFHGDFYCIEYHKVQVACNGLLFNNVYIEPSINLTGEETSSFKRILTDIQDELSGASADEMVLRSYLQLFLAKASSVKLKTMSVSKDMGEKDEQMEMFIQLLEKNYLNLHKPNDYANLLALSPNTFGKRCVRYFKKTPSAIIQERLILEAKKKLHLTRLSIKEIAYALNFEDESYFSRFFKKFTHVTPQAFREKTGISIVADLT